MEFLFGAGSMLGWSLWQARGAAEVAGFCNRDRKTWPAGIERGLHLNDADAVAQLFAAERPRLIVHCAGICDVEVCEASPDFAHAVNVEGTRLLVEHAPPDARIVYCSSDHVFSGDTGPYDELSPTDPLSEYGRTRVAAEQLMLARPNTLIVRSGPWIGPSASGRNGHLDWLRYRHSRGLPMTVIADEARCVVWAQDAARRVWSMAETPLTGIRHLVGSRMVSRPELAHFLVEKLGIDAHIQIGTRAEKNAPHPGRVELRTVHTDAFAAALPAVVTQL